MPEHVLMNDDIHGRCVSGMWHNIPPRIRIIGKEDCNFRIDFQIVLEQGGSILYFVIKNVTATCEYACILMLSRVIKTVVVKGNLRMYI